MKSVLLLIFFSLFTGKSILKADASPLVASLQGSSSYHSPSKTESKEQTQPQEEAVPPEEKQETEALPKLQEKEKQNNEKPVFSTKYLGLDLSEGPGSISLPGGYVAPISLGAVGSLVGIAIGIDKLNEEKIPQKVLRNMRRGLGIEKDYSSVPLETALEPTYKISSAIKTSVQNDLLKAIIADKKNALDLAMEKRNALSSQISGRYYSFSFTSKDSRLAQIEKELINIDAKIETLRSEIEQAENMLKNIALEKTESEKTTSYNKPSISLQKVLVEQEQARASVLNAPNEGNIENLNLISEEEKIPLQNNEQIDEKQKEKITVPERFVTNIKGIKIGKQ